MSPYDDWKLQSPDDASDEPWIPRYNATCRQCGEDYHKDRSDVGDLCDRCCAAREADRDALQLAQMFDRR